MNRGAAPYWEKSVCSLRPNRLEKIILLARRQSQKTCSLEFEGAAVKNRQEAGSLFIGLRGLQPVAVGVEHARKKCMIHRAPYKASFAKVNFLFWQQHCSQNCVTPQKHWNHYVSQIEYRGIEPQGKIPGAVCAYSAAAINPICAILTNPSLTCGRCADRDDKL